MLKQLQQVWYDNMQKMSSYIYEEILKTTARTSKQPQKQPQNQSPTSADHLLLKYWYFLKDHKDRLQTSKVQQSKKYNLLQSHVLNLLKVHQPKYFPTGKNQATTKATETPNKRRLF